MISLCPFWRSISSRISCSRAFRRRAAIDELRRSWGGVVDPGAEPEPPPCWGETTGTEVGDTGGEAGVGRLAGGGGPTALW